MNFNTNNTRLLARKPKGYVLPLVLLVMTILVMLAVGEMMSSYQARIQAVNLKSQTEALLAAEAGYEKAIFWMSKQTDILSAIQTGAGSGNLDFDSSHSRYQVSFLNFMGARPLFKVAVIGTSGRPVFGRAVNVAVVQEVTGWVTSCTTPNGPSATGPIQFGTGETLAMPLHINDKKDNPDAIDIVISGTPVFKNKVEMGEPRKTNNGSDKYTSVINCFKGGISFNQPYIRITDTTAVQTKINRFRDSTDAAYRFTPAASTLIANPRYAAVQLEFYVQGGIGYVRITNNCTIQACDKRTNDNQTYDYNMPGVGNNPFKKYNIYAYHYERETNLFPADRVIVPITNTYVRQSFGGYQSDPGGQIYVNGNVIIGGSRTTDPNQVVKGKLTVVASGNIWIGDNIVVDDDSGKQRDANGMPTSNNPNILGLIAQGVIKVVDPGISNYATSQDNVTYPGQAAATVGSGANKLYYKPVGNNTVAGSRVRSLPHNTVVEAALTVGGGGWGAENVARDSGSRTYGGRKEYNPGTMDNLIVRGAITEVVRGVVGLPGEDDGYNKNYYIDTRLMTGILPGDIWFSGKYIPAPAGWEDYSSRSID